MKKQCSIFLILGALICVGCDGDPTQMNTPAASPLEVPNGSAALEMAAEGSQVLFEPVSIDGAELADLLGVEAFKWVYKGPEGFYDLEIWGDIYRGDAEQPQRVDMGRFSALSVHEGFSLACILPMEEGGEAVFRISTRGISLSRRTQVDPLLDEASRKGKFGPGWAAGSVFGEVGKTMSMVGAYYGGDDGRGLGWSPPISGPQEDVSGFPAVFVLRIKLTPCETEEADAERAPCDPAFGPFS